MKKVLAMFLVSSSLAIADNNSIGLDTVVGATLGVAIGNQIGHGNGRTVAQVAGGLLGATVANNMRNSTPTTYYNPTGAGPYYNNQYVDPYYTQPTPPVTVIYANPYPVYPTYVVPIGGFYRPYYYRPYYYPSHRIVVTKRIYDRGGFHGRPGGVYHGANHGVGHNVNAGYRGRR